MITAQQQKSEPTMVSATPTLGKIEEWEFKKQGIGNEVTDRARVEVRFCSHFSFSRCPCSFRFSNNRSY